MVSRNTIMTSLYVASSGIELMSIRGIIISFATESEKSKTLFIIFLTVIGYVVGALLFSDKKKVKDWMDKILPPGRFR